ncbi:PASTA domain-containing protein [Actinacidiphila sp. ITFR-21]|uniref:PASTA domain-containing protein n=1 Tax=Actinacidiphila sp. ITFR-21 TaxID=3075199 RepID=UPI00288C21C5|nr:PASTA domain-containing protein [Streptomyces sp. ITFR-21]WNI14172.1 PASTA domain-containing protein [Streptomyces sp. ITFR-21]
MRTRTRAIRTRAATAVVLLAAAAILTACDPDTTGSGGAGHAVVKPVPDLVGKGLQSAQDVAESAGFRRLTSHDSAGRARHQIIDQDWKVCSQKPAAGTRASTDTKLDFGTVKLDETCPAADQAPPTRRRRPRRAG